MMDIQLRDDQRDCIEKVISKIKAGSKHLSVVMIPGLGERTTSLFLSNSLSSGEKKVAIVFRYIGTLSQTKSDAEKYGIASTDFFTVKGFLDNKDEYEYVILHDLNTADRKQLRDRLGETDSISISFSILGQEITGEKVNPEIRKRGFAYNGKDYQNV